MTAEFEELEKRIRHQIWAVDTLAKTKAEKLKAQGQKTAMELVLAWMTQIAGE